MFTAIMLPLSGFEVHDLACYVFLGGLCYSNVYPR